MKLDLRTGLAALVTVAALGVGGVAARANDAAPANPSAQYGKRIFAERFGKSTFKFRRRLWPRRAGGKQCRPPASRL